MKNSRTIKAAFLALGSGSRSLVGLAIAVILSRLLTKEDYATYRQTVLSFEFVAPVLGLGLPASILYFIPRSPEKARSTIVEILLVTVLTSSLFAAFILLGGAGLIANAFDNPALRTPLKWFAFYPLVFLPATVVTPVLVSQDKAPWVAGFSAGSACFRLLAVIGPILLIAREPLYAVQGLVVGVLGATMAALVLIFRALPRTGSVSPETNHIVQLIKYSLPLSLGTMIGSLNKNMDKVLVSILAEPARFAVFVNGATEIPLLRMAYGSAAQVMMPEVSSMYKENRHQQAIDLFRRGTFKTALILMPLTGFLFVIAPGLLVILYGAGFAESALYFQIYLFIVPFKSILYTMLFQAAGRTDLIFYRALLSLLLNTTLTIVLIVTFGLVGAAVGTLVTTVCILMPYELVTCSRIYQVKLRDFLPYSSLGKLALLIAVISVVSHFSTNWFVRDSALFRCILTGGAFVALAAPSLYFLYGRLLGLRKNLA